MTTSLYETGGEEGLQDLSRNKSNPKNRVPEHVEQAALEIAIENPVLDQLRAANELNQKGIIVSQGGIRSVWLRHNLATLLKPLKALETKVAEEGIILTEEQVAALEKLKE